MILVDTNVLSEPLRPAPDPVVVGWINRQAVETLYLSAISLAEIRFGIAALAVGRRRDRFRTAFEGEILRVFEGRIVAFDESAAAAYARIRAAARASGRAIGVVDGYIAATAAAHDFAVATRDVGPFQAAGVDVVNPWTAP